MTRRHALFAAVIACLTSAGANAQARQIAPAEFVGCYRVEVGAWSKPAGNSPAHRLPDTIRLTGTANQHGWVVTPNIAYTQPARAFPPAWNANGDSVRIMWSNGFQVTTVHLKSVHVGELRGTATARSDAVPPHVVWPAAPVTARRTACADAVSPAAMAFAARVAGCYALDPGPWRSTRVHAGDISTAGTPLRFELTAERMQGMEELQHSESPWFHVRSLDADRASNHTFLAWRRQGDSIFVSDGPIPSSGVSLDLVPKGRDLVGTVVLDADYVMKDQASEVSRRVRARRVACTQR